jgi:hypothetical protein
LAGDIHDGNISHQPTLSLTFLIRSAVLLIMGTI